MTWKKVNNADAGDSTHFGGNDLDKISDVLSGVNSDTVTLHDTVANGINQYLKKFGNKKWGVVTYTGGTGGDLPEVIGAALDVLLNEFVDVAGQAVGHRAPPAR